MSGPERNEDNVNTFGVVLIGVSSTVLVWVTVVLLQAYYQQTADSLQVERDAEGKSKEVRSVRASQRSSLREARYVNGPEGTKMASIPLDIAKSKVLEDAAAKRASLVPAVPGHNIATVPAVPGKPAAAAPPDPAAAAPPTDAASPGDPAPPTDAAPAGDEREGAPAR